MPCITDADKRIKQIETSKTNEFFQIGCDECASLKLHAGQGRAGAGKIIQHVQRIAYRRAAGRIIEDAPYAPPCFLMLNKFHSQPGGGGGGGGRGGGGRRAGRPGGRAAL